MKKLFKAFLALTMACTLVTNAGKVNAEENAVLDVTVSVDQTVLGTVEVDEAYNMTANVIKGGTFDLGVLTVNAKTSNLEQFGIPSTEKTKEVSTGLGGLEVGLDDFLSGVVNFNTATVVGSVDGEEFSYTLTNTTTEADETYVISGVAGDGVAKAVEELYSHVTVVAGDFENVVAVPEGTEHYALDDDTFVLEVPARSELVYHGYKLVLNEDVKVTLTGEGVAAIIVEQIEDIDFKTITREELAQVMALLIDPLASAINNQEVELVVEFDSPFADVAKANETLWYYSPIIRANALGLMTGKSESNFAKDDLLSRAATATVIYRMQGKPEVSSENPANEKFPDVADTWYTDAITWANENEVVTGHGNGTFKPDAGVTRQQLALMLYRYAKNVLGADVSNTADLSSYPDSTDVAPWAKEAMEWAVGNEIVKGNDATKTLNPTGTAKRSECAVMIMRFYDQYVK